MHDLLQEMGQQIVQRQSLEEPGKPSRLWKENDIHHVLTRETGSEVVEGLILESPRRVLHLSAQAFLKMTNLRLLKISSVRIPKGFEFPSSELRLLEWHGYPLKSLPSTLQLDKTFEVSMCSSHIENLWKGIKCLNQLKILRLGNSRNLIRTPDFTGAPNLEELILAGCTRLCVIHPSLLLHEKLLLLNLKDCTNLTILPRKIAMKSIKELVLSGCSMLRNFPEVGGSMNNLLELLLDQTAIKELSISFEILPRLILLNLKDCKNLESLPSTMNGLKCLKTLNLCGCSKLKKFPEIGRSVKCLSKLILDGTAITELPSSIEFLSRLGLLSLTDCNYLVRLPSTINGWKSLKTLKLSGCSKLKNVPGNLGQLQSLKVLDVSGTAITRPASSIFSMKNLQELSFGGCRQTSLNSMPLMLPSLSGLSSLKKLDLSDCSLDDGAIPIDICNLLPLLELNLRRNHFTSLPATINRLSKLHYLNLDNCKKLKFLPKLPCNIWAVRVDGCASLETISDSLKSCKTDFSLIHCINCFKLHSYNFSAFSMLKCFLEEMSIPRSKFSIVVPGSRAPEWFSYQNEGSSINRPPDFGNGKMLVGYAICSVFHVRKHQPTFEISSLYHTQKLSCRMKAGHTQSSVTDFIHFNDYFGRAVSDHLWLLYLSCQECYSKDIKECNDLEFLFRPDPAPGMEVKRCGVHPVYVQELEEFNSTTKQLNSSTVWYLNEFDSAAISKGSLTESGGEEASGNDDGYEEPQAKRLNQL